MYFFRCSRVMQHSDQSRNLSEALNPAALTARQRRKVRGEVGWTIRKREAISWPATHHEVKQRLSASAYQQSGSHSYKSKHKPEGFQHHVSSVSRRCDVTVSNWVLSKSSRAKASHVSWKFRYILLVNCTGTQAAPQYHQRSGTKTKGRLTHVQRMAIERTY